MFGNTLSAKGQHSPHALLRYWTKKPHIIPLLYSFISIKYNNQKRVQKLFNIAFTHVLHFPFSFLDNYAWNSSQD